MVEPALEEGVHGGPGLNSSSWRLAAEAADWSIEGWRLGLEGEPGGRRAIKEGSRARRGL